MAKPSNKTKEFQKIEGNPFEGRVGLVYARVSSKKQELEGSGLQSQEGRCIAELGKLQVPYNRSFLDTYSGAGDFRERPAMRELLAYIDANPHKKFVVVFDDIKRLARDVPEHFKLRAAFKVRDSLIHSPNYNFDDSPEGEFTELLFAGQAQLERKQNRRQVIQKMSARLALGYWSFGRKRGYDMVIDPLHGKLAVPNEDGAVIRVALEGFASGKFRTQTEVAQYFAELNFWKKGKSPNRLVSNVKDILTDPFYCGEVEYPPWEISRRKGRHEGLISKETYEVIQINLRKPHTKKLERADISKDFPLRGLLVCPHCNRHLTGAWAKKKQYAHYFCQNLECPLRNKTLRKDDVERNFSALLKRNRLKAKVEPLVNVAFERVWKQEIKALEAKETLLAQRRKDLRHRIAELTDRVLTAQSEAVRKAYEVEIEKASNELDDGEIATNKSDLEIPYRTALSKVIGILKEPSVVWESVDVLEKRRLFFFLFEGKLAYSKEEGYRTGDSLSLTRLFEEITTDDSALVDPTGIEPVASSLQMRRSTK